MPRPSAAAKEATGEHPLPLSLPSSSTSPPGGGGAVNTTPSTITSPSRRRPRVDSETSLPPDFPVSLTSGNSATSSSAFFSTGPNGHSSQSAKPRPKRSKITIDDFAMPPAAPASAVGRSASGLPSSSAAKGKAPAPEIVDLTRRTTTSFQPVNGAKKLVIKNLQTKKRAEAIASYYTRTWDELREALQAVFAGQKPKVPLERLYRGVEDICRQGNADAERLYEMLRRGCEEHLTSRVLASIRKGTGQRRGGGGRGAEEGGEVLGAVLEEWKVWNKQAAVIGSTFSFLDRSFLLKHSTLYCINDLMIKLFRHMVFKDSAPDGGVPLRPLVLQNISDQVLYARTGDDRFQAPLFKDAIMMFNVMDVYGKYFEPVFLDNSRQYFLQFGQDQSGGSLRSYIFACQKLLRAEDHRCMAFNLDSTTKKLLLESARNILVDGYATKLLDGDSVSKLLSGDDIESMRALYELLRLSNKHKSLKEPWADYIKTAGATIVGDTARADDMVLRLLELRRQLDLMIRDALSRDEDFTWALRESFGHFMNDRDATKNWDSGTAKVGEMIAKYIDGLLRGGIKALPKNLLSDARDRAEAEKRGEASTGDVEDVELDRQLDQALELFRFISGKDAFEAFYKRDLARRLLLGRSASQDAERNMLTKLRGECGSNFTQNLEQMFKDQELCREEMAAYKLTYSAGIDEEDGRQRKSALDLHVMVLSASAWPSYPDVELRLPDDVSRHLARFDGHYRNKHTGRILHWKHALSHALVKAKFAKASHELQMSAFQAVVLLLFNNLPDKSSSSSSTGGFLSYDEISAATGLQGQDLDRTLQSLACGKARVLTKHPKGKDVNPTDTFSVNEKFSDQKYRVKINQIQMKETKEENKATHERIAQDRRFETQAAIVRVMKSRKTMGHSELVAEVINLTKSRGSVDAGQIKKEIEALIEKDYIEREGNSYCYVA